MRKYLFVVLTMVSFFVSGCMSFDIDKLSSDSGPETGEKMQQQIGFRGARYAKLNSVGCTTVSDAEMIKNGDFDAIDNLIKEKHCFVIPTNSDVYIKERVKGDIVSAKLKDSTQLFYTMESNLDGK